MDQDFFKLGVQAANAGDYQKAQAYFIRVVQANPNSEKGWLYLGHCLSDPGKKIDCYKRVLRINPSNLEAQNALSALSQPVYPQEEVHDLYERQPPPVRSADQARQTPPVIHTAKPQKRSSNKVGWILGSVAGLVVCLGAVCFAVSKMPPATPAPPTPTLTPTPSLPSLDAAALPAPMASTGAGKVCIGYWYKGLACLDENGWQTYNMSNSEIPTDSVTVGTFCPDGRLAIAHQGGVSLVRDQQWEHIPEIGVEYGEAKYLACDRDGRIWAAHFKGVSRYVDGAWQTYNIGMLASGDLSNQSVDKVFAAPDGRVWVLTPQSVAMFADEKWTVFQKGFGLPETPSALALDAAGRAWVWYKNGVAIYDNGTWKQFQSTSPISPASISLDARGWLWMQSAFNGVAAFDGGAWITHNLESNSLTTDRVNTLATDSLGRVWVATPYGVSVFDGSQWQKYKMDNFDLIDNDIAFVVVERDGPPLPPPVDKEKGSIIGIFPVPGARMEICVLLVVEPFSGDTPCSGQPFTLAIRSEANGDFVFENVPPGYYYLFADTGDSWADLNSGFGSKRILVEPGEIYDLGLLQITMDPQ